VILGDHNYNVAGDGEVFITVQTKLEHPQYNRVTYIYDFSLLRLATPAVLSSNVALVCLPPDVSQVGGL
jgi:hypothetical protein